MFSSESGTKSSTESKKIKEISNTSTKLSQSHASDVENQSWLPSYDKSLYSIVCPVKKLAHQRSKKPLMKVLIQSETFQSTQDVSSTQLIVEKTKRISLSENKDMKNSVTSDTSTNRSKIEDCSSDECHEKKSHLSKEMLFKGIEEVTSSEKRSVTLEQQTSSSQVDESKKKSLELLESAWKELQDANPYKKSKQVKTVGPDLTKQSFTSIETKTDDLKIPGVPKTCCQFELDWRTLKSNEMKLYLYLKQINGLDFPDIFQDGLESNILMDILTCLNNQFLPLNESVSNYLLGISNMRRLDTLVMFMMESEKLLLSKLVNYCQDNNELSSNIIQQLKQKFEL